MSPFKGPVHKSRQVRGRELASHSPPVAVLQGLASLTPSASRLCLSLQRECAAPVPWNLPLHQQQKAANAQVLDTPDRHKASLFDKTCLLSELTLPNGKGQPRPHPATVRSCMAMQQRMSGPHVLGLGRLRQADCHEPL